MANLRAYLKFENERVIVHILELFLAWMYLVILLEHPNLDGEVKISTNSQEEADEGMEWWQDQVNEKVGKSVAKAFLGPVSFHTSIPFSSKDLLTVAVGHKPFVVVLKGYL